MPNDQALRSDCSKSVDGYASSKSFSSTGNLLLQLDRVGKSWRPSVDLCSNWQLLRRCTAAYAHHGLLLVKFRDGSDDRLIGTLGFDRSLARANSSINEIQKALAVCSHQPSTRAVPLVLLGITLQHTVHQTCNHNHSSHPTYDGANNDHVYLQAPYIYSRTNYRFMSLDHIV